MSESRRSAAWGQFLVARRKMLEEYDRALVHAREQGVVTHHGVVGEAAVRKWLSDFLPKRYGVCCGHIRSQEAPVPHQTAHFDVIVYDQLDSPILWVESNEDKSEGGRSRIIPAEYVRAVLEVKAAFNRAAVKAAIEKLQELAPLTAGVDANGERYPKFLPQAAFLGMVFFELREDNGADFEALEAFREVSFGRPFYGAAILRGEGIPPDETGLVARGQSDAALPRVAGANGLLGRTVLTKSVLVGGSHLAATLMWSDLLFSRFAFDLLALLNGTYEQGRVSSFHGVDLSGLIR